MRGGRPPGHDRAARLGAVLAGAVVLFALLGPLLVTADPARQDLAGILRPPSADSWLGTDHLGRSVLSRLAHAARLSVLLSALSVFAAAVPGIALGLLAAACGGAVDRALAAAADALMALPALLLVVLVAAMAPGTYWALFVGLAVAGTAEWFRLARAASASLLAAPAVEAARLLGFGWGHVLRRHVLPPLGPLAGTLAAFAAANAVLALGVLGFVGIGLRPPTADWGLMMTEMLPYYDEAPLALLAPASCLFTLLLGLQLLSGRRSP